MSKIRRIVDFICRSSRLVGRLCMKKGFLQEKYRILFVKTFDHGEGTAVRRGSLHRGVRMAGDPWIDN